MPYEIGDTLVRTVFQQTSNLPEDEVVFTLAFDWQGALAPTTLARTDLGAAMVDFWAGSGGASRFLSAFLSGSISRAVDSAVIEQVPIVVGSLGSPVLVTPFTPSAAKGAISFPNEVSVHIELIGDIVGVPEESGGTRPRGRRRGGPRFGPVNAACATETNEEPRVDINGEFGNDVVAAFESIAVVPTVGGDWVLAIWSRADQELRPAQRIRIDNAFDTQRSRGRKESAARTVLLPAG